jgi:PTH1 family peptidyl-tRNA hydrolase
MSIFDLFKKIEKQPQGGEISHIVVGLGNPGGEYEKTRHNAGFIAIDRLCDSLGVKCDRAKFKALCCEATIGENRVLIMKPQTYMNKSGEAISEASRFYKIPADKVIVISDDVTLAVGKLRIRGKGSAGGHNGLKSIIEHLGTQEFPRIKLGVGEKPHPDYDMVDWVLGKFPKEDFEALSKTVESVPSAVATMINGDITTAMNRFNR